jgi:drug/metabolite transporter (DMT)-like permease
VGLAFYAWDHGTKHGDLRLLGVLSYLTPVLSTLWLVLAGRAEAGVMLGLACALVAGGAWLAARRG